MPQQAVPLPGLSWIAQFASTSINCLLSGRWPEARGALLWDIEPDRFTRTEPSVAKRNGALITGTKLRVQYGHFGPRCAETPHFSDRGVLLYNTLDYPAYSLAIERMKCAFRMSYSLLDKIAYFLNDYFELAIPETRVSFRTVWYEGQERKRGLRSEFRRRQNYPLRGMFWLSKDLYESTPGFRETVEPDAQALAEIRNHLEHKYLKIHEIMVPREIVPDPLVDRLAFSVERRDFEAKAFWLLRMTRAALIYLSLAIHAEEQEKSVAHGDKPVLPMPLSRWEDEWKT